MGAAGFGVTAGAAAGAGADAGPGVGPVASCAVALATSRADRTDSRSMGLLGESHTLDRPADRVNAWPAGRPRSLVRSYRMGRGWVMASRLSTSSSSAAVR
ncbi:MAG: hypothetical protein H6P99_2121 [Holophagaceae bacterium]|nr:hypothetical protein [Holophagaceae bacterium]